MQVEPAFADALRDRYRIERELGQGGMATVYLAQDVKHDRKVALKVLRPELAAVIGAERFLPRSRPPPTCSIRTSCRSTTRARSTDSLPLLRDALRRGRIAARPAHREKQLPVDDAVRIATEVASALDYAHRHGVIHRDIKPENILLHDGRALVADFGIALAVSKAGGTRMTETGHVPRHPALHEPRAGDGRAGDRRPDGRLRAGLRCSTRCSLGEPPFTGPTAQAIVAKVITEEPRPLLPRRRTIPPHVEAAVLTALQKLPADRFADAAQFAGALSNPAFGEGSRATRVASYPKLRAFRTGRSMLAVAAAGALAGLVLGASLMTWWRGPSRSGGPVTRVTVASRRSRRSSSTFPFALSKDGSRLVYHGIGGRGWFRELNRLDATRVPEIDGAVLPVLLARRRDRRCLHGPPWGFEPCAPHRGNPHDRCSRLGVERRGRLERRWVGLLHDGCHPSADASPAQRGVARASGRA